MFWSKGQVRGALKKPRLLVNSPNLGSGFHYSAPLLGSVKQAALMVPGMGLYPDSNRWSKTTLKTMLKCQVLSNDMAGEIQCTASQENLLATVSSPIKQGWNNTNPTVLTLCYGQWTEYLVNVSTILHALSQWIIIKLSPQGPTSNTVTLGPRFQHTHFRCTQTFSS